MAETYETEDLGTLVDVTDSAVPITGDVIPMRKAGWTSFALDMDEEEDARVTIFARATPDGTLKDATSALLGISQITAAGYYEVVIPTMAWEIQIRSTFVNSSNRILLRMAVGRSF